MKCSIMKLLALALCVLMMGSIFMTSCNQTPPSDNNDNNETPEPLTEQTVPLNMNTKGIKVLGVRNLKSETVINADWSASGIEFFATCEGDMTFDVVTNNKNAYFRAYVDDEEWMNDTTPYYTVGGEGKIVLKDIPRGTHRIKVIKVTGYTLANAAFTQVTLKGTIAEEAPADQDLYIEFVGDSITCGWGTIGTFDGNYNSQDATLAYSYLLADALHADYSMTALSGQGICCGNPGIPLGYRYACYAKDSTNEYDFSRKADLVILNIGTNDETKKLDERQFEADLKAFVQYAKEKNGENCRFLAIYNMKNGNYSYYIKSAFEQLGGERAGYYVYEAKRSTNEATYYHPSVEEHAAYIPELRAICTQLLKAEITPK